MVGKRASVNRDDGTPNLRSFLGVLPRLAGEGSYRDLGLKASQGFRKGFRRTLVESTCWRLVLMHARKVLVGTRLGYTYSSTLRPKHILHGYMKP